MDVGGKEGRSVLWILRYGRTVLDGSLEAAAGEVCEVRVMKRRLVGSMLTMSWVCSVVLGAKCVLRQVERRTVGS